MPSKLALFSIVAALALQASLAHSGPYIPDGVKAVKPVLINGVDYRVEADPTAKNRAVVLAIDLATEGGIWQVEMSVPEGTAAAPSVREVAGRPVLEVADGFSFVIDPASKSATPLRDARTKGQGATCEVHDRGLVEGFVRISYGKPIRPLDLNPEARATFPNAAVNCHAGCMVREEREALVRFCPDCRKARKIWVDLHPKG